MLQPKRSYYLKNGDKFSKFRPEWLLAWVKMEGKEPRQFIVDKIANLKQGLKMDEDCQNFVNNAD